MANIPVNAVGTLLSGSGAVTGSFAGFTVAQAVTITGLKDANGVNLAGTGLTFPTGITVPLFVTSASISTGAIILYP
jgi:hypothetical protein